MPKGESKVVLHVLIFTFICYYSKLVNVQENVIYIMKALILCNKVLSLEFCNNSSAMKRCENRKKYISRKK